MQNRTNGGNRRSRTVEPAIREANATMGGDEEKSKKGCKVRRPEAMRVTHTSDTHLQARDTHFRYTPFFKHGNHSLSLPTTHARRNPHLPPHHSLKTLIEPTPKQNNNSHLTNPFGNGKEERDEQQFEQNLNEKNSTNPPSPSNRRPKLRLVVAAASPSPSRWSSRRHCSLHRALTCRK
ncbi:hypothetical protein PIB30_035669 [Stylosanthes scabra]|uniref:Uncharacterized protein n=1 Tax=Stylosanthes scabra TaxID=79078 RepID=A0ABU6TCX4_9FABA|nr:hypothetical protein [Stylosanthes scabra]